MISSRNRIGVPYVYARSLELEGRHPHDVGQWGITNMRLLYAEGLPKRIIDVSIAVYPDGTFGPTPLALYKAFRFDRRKFYKRVHTAKEVARFITSSNPERLTKVCLPITASWIDPPDGVIPLPTDTELFATETHAVHLVQPFRLKHTDGTFNTDRLHFLFENSWGEDWGREGRAMLPFEYYDRYAFDQWLTYRQDDLISFRHKWLYGNLGAWQARDEFDRRVYAFEVGDPEAERIGWAFAIETDGAIEVEELYVAHAHRRTGVATRLAERLAALAKAKGLPLRVWVSFADVASESPATVAALPRLAHRMGVEFQRSPVRWAGYFATNEMPGSPTPVEPDRVPGRPKSTLGALTAFAAMAVGSTEPSFSTTLPPAGLTVPMNGFHSAGESWDEQNRRRIDLIHKKWQGGGLDADDQAELVRLQAVARSLVAAALPPPLLTPAERAYVDSKAGH